MANGVFINIEGPDASGKETQWNLLVDRLKDAGYTVYAQDFPAYDRTAAGQELYDYLHSDEEKTLREESQLFVEDRRALKDELEAAINAGYVVVTDRYAQSNWAYQTTGMTHEDRWAFIDWMKEEEQALPQPDVTVYVDMPVEQALTLIKNRDGEADRNENRETLEQVVAAYRDIAAQEDWVVLNPMKQDWDDQPILGTEWLRSPQEIHEEIWEQVSTYLD